MTDANASGSQTKKFVFRGPKSPLSGVGEHVEIVIPELLQASYSSYTWPSAPVLAWFLWTQRQSLKGKKVLELGSGTALPGILAAKCGANVTLTDCFTLKKTLSQLEKCCLTNNLTPGQDIKIMGLTWGLFLGDIFELESHEIIISSDCFYDPCVFEDIIMTVSFLIDKSDAKFICTYQERSSDWSIEALLKKWSLKCSLIDLDTLGANSGIDFNELMGDHSIHLLEISAS